MILYFNEDHFLSLISQKSDSNEILFRVKLPIKFNAWF